MAYRAEVPVPARIAELCVTAEHSGFAVAVPPPNVLHMHVEDSVGEFADKLHIIYALVPEVRGVVVESEALVAADSLQGAFRGGYVEGDFRRVDFQREVYALFVEGVENRLPALCEVFVSGFNHFFGRRREGIEVLPYRRARKACHCRGNRGFGERLGAHFHKSFADGGRLDHFGSRALAHAFGIAIAPDVVLHHRLVAGVDIVAHALPDEVVRERKAIQAVCGQDIPAAFQVVLIVGLCHVEVVGGKRNFQAFVAHVFREGREVFEFHVGPLSGEYSQRSCHIIFLCLLNALIGIKIIPAPFSSSIFISSGNFFRAMFFST